MSVSCLLKPVSYCYSVIMAVWDLHYIVVYFRFSFLMSLNNCHQTSGIIVFQVNGSSCSVLSARKSAKVIICVNATCTTDAELTLVLGSLTDVNTHFAMGPACVQCAYLELERWSSGVPLPCSFFTSISLLLRSTSLIFPREPPLCRAPLPSFKHTPALVYYIFHTYKHTQLCRETHTHTDLLHL